MAATDNSPTAAAQVKLPNFTPIDAQTWFRRAEVQFRLKKENSPTARADYVLAALPEDIFTRIAEWLQSKGDAPVNYTDLKAFLLQRFTPSPAARVAQLLQLAKQPLGDQKPSDALLEMRALARLPPTDDGEPRHLDLLRALWLQRLPDTTRALLPNAEEMDDDRLQLAADRLNDAHLATTQHINAAPPPPTPPDGQETDTAAITKPPRPQRPPRQHQQPHPNPHQQTTHKPTHRWCFYHYKFGAEARNCAPGCRWPKNA